MQVALFRIQFDHIPCPGIASSTTVLSRIQWGQPLYVPVPSSVSTASDVSVIGQSL